MSFYEGVINNLDEEFSESSLNLIKEFCDKCEEVWIEGERCDCDAMFNHDDRVLSVMVKFEGDEITIKNKSAFWELLDVIDGLKVAYVDPTKPITELMFSIGGLE